MQAADISEPFSTYWLTFQGLEHSLRYVDAAGVRTRVFECGDRTAPALFMLHGSGGSLEAYASNFAAHARRFRVIGLDMLGHGYTDKPDHPYEPQHYAEHLLAVADVLGIDRFHVSGESLGGWVAARLASTHPDRVIKLVLNTAAGVHYDPEISRRFHAMSMAAAAEPSAETVRKRLELLMFDPNRVTQEMVDLRLRFYSQPGHARVMQNIMCLHTPEYRLRNLLGEEECARIVAPTLVLWTTHDPGSTVEIGKKLAGMIPNAQWRLMEDCGHWPQFEDPDTFNKVQIEFLLGSEVGGA